MPSSYDEHTGDMLKTALDAMDAERDSLRAEVRRLREANSAKYEKGFRAGAMIAKDECADGLRRLREERDAGWEVEGELERLRTERDAARAVLRGYEWGEATHQSDVFCCRDCGAEATLDPVTYEPIGTHASDCALRAALGDGEE